MECVPNSEQERLWFFPGELLSAKVAIAGSGLVNGAFQTEFSVGREGQLYSDWTEKDRKTATVRKLAVLHDDTGPQVKVLLHDLQQLVLVPVGRAVVEH